MTIQIADKITKGLTSKDILLEVAVMLYLMERVSLGKAAKIAGLHRMEFQAALDKRQIAIHYDIKDFERERQKLQSLRA